MPNWCYTNYVVEGPEEQVCRLNELLNSLAAMPAPGLVENGFGSNWLGNIVAALGVDPFKTPGVFRCRGEFLYVEMGSDGLLRFDTFTAWVEADDTRHLIEEKFPGVKLWYISEELGCEYWATNDIDGRYFSEKYYCNFNVDGDCVEDPYFQSFEELADYVFQQTKQKAETYEQIIGAVEDFDNRRTDGCATTLLKVCVED